MHEIYDRWPEIARQSYESIESAVDFENIDHVVFSGMGGSGTIGDVFSAMLSKSKIHTYVNKGYLLPKTVDSDTLVVTTSISGNTVETLTVLQSANKTGCKIIAFSAGGIIQQYCEKNNILHKHLNFFHSPRSSLPSFLYSMLKFLEPVFAVNKDDVFESLKLLETTQQKINSYNLTENNLSLNLANWMSGIPIIYYPWGLQAAALRFKNSLHENAKTHAIAEDVIEASHNAIVSWERPSNVQPILIQGQDDYIKTKERWGILKEYFKINNIPYWEVLSEKGSILSKLINLIYVLDYSTIYKAVLSKIDPSPISSLDFIKGRLEK